MENTSHSEFEDYQSSTLLAKLKDFNLNSIERTNQIIDELRRRGYTEQVEEIEQNLIKEYPIYGRFWRRFLATFVDNLLVAFIGALIGLIFKPLLVKVGSYGLFFGLGISVTYWTLLNSSRFGGQTIGKKLVKLKVVDNNMQLLSYKKSFMRAFVLVIPMLIYYVFQIGIFNSQYLNIFMNCFIMFILALTSLLVVINKPTRQSLHDLLVGTYVVDLEAYPKQHLINSSKSRIIISALISLFIAIAFSLIVSNLFSFASFQELLPTKNKLEELPLVIEANIAQLNPTHPINGNHNSNSNRVFIINLRLSEDVLTGKSTEEIEKSNVVQKSILILLNDYKSLDSSDQIIINLLYGVSFGIFNDYNSRTCLYSIEKWREIVNEPKSNYLQ